MKEELQPQNPEQLLEAVEIAAAKQDWEEVDRLVPFASQMDGDRLVVVVRASTRDENNDFRDAAMTLWSFITPVGREARIKHFRRALEIMMGDDHECAAVWAAVTVARYAEDEEFWASATEALRRFRERVSLMDLNEQGKDWSNTRSLVVEKVGNKVPDLKNLI